MGSKITRTLLPFSAANLLWYLGFLNLGAYLQSFLSASSRNNLIASYHSHDKTLSCKHSFHHPYCFWSIYQALGNRRLTRIALKSVSAKNSANIRSGDLSHLKVPIIFKRLAVEWSKVTRLLCHYSTASAVDFQGGVCSFRLFSSLSGGSSFSSLFLFFLLLGLNEVPFLFSLDCELKRSLYRHMNYSISLLRGGFSFCSSRRKCTTRTGRHPKRL